MRQLRYYQRAAKDAVEWGWETDPRLLLKLPTGSGKNFTAAKLLEDMQPGRCLFVADQDELCAQPRSEIQKSTGIIAALDKAKDRASLQSQIVVGSSQTLARESKKGSGVYPRLERYPRNHFDYIISDEVHRGTDRDAMIWDYFENARVCGMTATPYRSNLANLSKWLPKTAYEMDIIDLVEEGFAPEPLLLTLPVEIDIEAIKVKRGFEGKDYDLDSVDSIITPHYLTIAELMKENAKGRHGIVYLPLIRSSMDFAAILRKVGIKAVHIDGTSDNRDAILHAFGNGEIEWLCNATLLSTGVDLPRCDAFLNLRLTQSRSWYQQARGRAMRVLPGVIDDLPEKEQIEERRDRIAFSDKPNALILDLLLQNDKLGAAHGAEDFCRNEHDAKMLFERSKTERTPFEISAMAKKVQEEREAALVSALERAAIRSSLHSPMLADQAAALLGETDLLDYIPVQRWEQEPPSKQQLDALAGMGIDPHSIQSKGKASELITVMVERRKLGYCTMKQVKLIKQMGERKSDSVKKPELLSMEEATRIIDTMSKARRRAVT